ncbi:MAG: flagellar regulator YcgR PilZN domain-containing protein [Sinimarinibacterium sp.]
MSTADAAEEYEDLSGTLLRSSAGIESLLHRLRLHRSLLSVRAEGSQRWHTSMVVAVDPQSRQFDLDALHPAPRQDLAAGTHLLVRGRVEGGDLRFRCNVVGTTTANSEAPLKAALPDEIFVFERRGAFRLSLPTFLNLPPSRVGRALPEHNARLVDISHTGAGAVVPGTVEPAIDDTLRVRIQLPGTVIDAEAEVRSVTPGNDGIRVGLQLGRLRSQDEAHLAQAINSLERQLIRAVRTRR